MIHVICVDNEQTVLRILEMASCSRIRVCVVMLGTCCVVWCLIDPIFGVSTRTRASSQTRVTCCSPRFATSLWLFTHKWVVLDALDVAVLGFWIVNNG